MEDFNKQLLIIYGSVFFFISLMVFYVVFRGFLLLMTPSNKINQGYITNFYITVGIMSVTYILFIGIVFYFILKGREKDLELKSYEKYINWRLR